MTFTSRTPSPESNPPTVASVPVRNLFDVPVHAATMEQALSICEESVANRKKLMIGVVNAAKIVNMRKDPLLRQSVVESDVVFADGMSIVVASRLLGQSLPERVTGIDLFERLLKLADERGYGVYFLGAKHEVLDEVVARVRATYPGVRIAGSRDGYFSEDESDNVAAAISATRPDMLFVAMSPPKKEIFLGRYGTEMDVSLCHGVGGSFDVFAGKTKRAPAFFQKLCLEWLYRIIQEPKRMWRRYLVTNSVFMGLFVRAFCHRWFWPRRRGEVVGPTDDFGESDAKS